MSETYVADDQEQLKAGGLILMVCSVLSAVLVLAGLIYAMGAGQRNQAALTAAGCEPGLSPSGLQCTTAQMLTSQYLAILTPASQQVNADMTAYTVNERQHLIAAEAALTGEVMSEHDFDTSLAGIEFPSAIAPIATALIQADQTLAKLTGEQAQSTSLTELRSFNHRVQLANAAVAADMLLIRTALG
jgi:hypothetical protein